MSPLTSFKSKRENRVLETLRANVFLAKVSENSNDQHINWFQEQITFKPISKSLFGQNQMCL